MVTTADMRLGQCQAVILHVVAVGSLNLLNLIAAAGRHSHHINPENILHTGTGHGAAVLLSQGVQPVNLGRCGGPGINCLLAGGDDVSSPGHAFFHMLINIPDKAEQGNHRHIGVAPM